MRDEMELDMEQPKSFIPPAQIVDLFDGSYSKSVDAIMSLGRAMWELSFKSDLPGREVLWPEGTYSRVNGEELFGMLPFPEEVASTLLNNLRYKELCRYLKDGRISFNLNVFQPFFLGRLLLGGVRPDNDLRYFVMRNIRTHYRCDLSSQTAHLFQVLADAVNSYRVRKSNKRQGPKYTWHYTKELLPYLKSELERDAWSVRRSEEDVKLFIECCREIGYLLPHYESGCIDFRTTTIDAAYILTNTFGIPTRMRGFDELFGGGGLMLPERLGDAGSNDLGGRAVLIMGRFGTGKSLLSLQLSVEVARKGGLAWVMPLEQSAQECLYTLETMGALRYDKSMVVATDVLTASRLLDERPADRGVLIILKTIKDKYEDFLDVLRENAKRMEKYTLRLLTVDPINSIQRGKTNLTALRAQTLKVIEDIKRAGTNVLMVAEGDANKGDELLFEQNIADTVIHLSVDNEHGYAARSFEVKKSRLQREQRGKHPFSIVPGVGWRVFPAPAAVSARTRSRGMTQHRDVVRFGMSALDDILGQGAITEGDVIAFQGAGGSFKTPLGLIFLLSSDRKTGRRNQLPLRSLLISARDDEASIRYMLGQNFVTNHINSAIRNNLELASTHKTVEDVTICSLPRGHIQPGYILQRLEDELTEARLSGYWIDRIMIDNIAHWETSSPFVSTDETFGDTLIDFLRRHRVTSLLVCGQVPLNSSSVVQRSIIDGADCLIQFDRIEFRGTHRVMLQVLKTRGMRHRGESFEITLGPKMLDVKPTSSLLRVAGGEITPVSIRLFLNSKSQLRREYNNRLIEAIRSVLSEKADIAPQDRIYQSRVMGLGKLSAIDELQVLQLDEFQLPSPANVSDPDFILYKFPLSLWEEREWGDFLPSLSKRVCAANESFFAVPFYENISLLAYRDDLLKDKPIRSWRQLAAACVHWERDNPEPQNIFFDFPKASTENYNGLFLEILLEFVGIGLPLEEYQLPRLLNHPDAVQACKIYRRLCRRAYLATDEGEIVVRQIQEAADPIKLNTNAVVWRHWYTTLNQMLHKLGREEREKIKVAPLPNEIAISGEWYCGVTSYSAAPDVGLEIIKMLTSHEAELDRLQSGVGLPTRTKFYQGIEGNTSGGTSISPYMSMDLPSLERIINNAFRRSDIKWYSQFSNILAHHLQRIIAIPDAQEEMIEEEIRAHLKSLDTRMSFILADMN